MGNSTLHPSPISIVPSPEKHPGAYWEGAGHLGMGGVLSRQMRGRTSANSASLASSCYLFPYLSQDSFPVPCKAITSTDMGSQWLLLLLLLLLLIGDGALNLPGIVTILEVASHTTLSTKDYAPNETTSYSSTASALPNKKTDDISAATPPTSPQTSSSTGSTEQTIPSHGTQEEKLNTTITATSKVTTLSNSMMTSTLKDQGGTLRTTALSSMATSPETPKQNQSTLFTAPLTSNTTVSGMESSVSTDSEMSATTTAPPALNTAGNDANSPRPMTTTVSENSAVTTSPRTSNKVTNVKESSPMTTSAVIHSTLLNTTTLGTTVLGTTVSGIQEGKPTAALPAPTTAPRISKPHHNAATQTPSYPAESAPSMDTATAQSPETMAAHSTALIPSSSGTTKSSITRTSQASPKHTQSSSPGTEACTLDEYPDSRGVCRCNKSYYAHSELFRVSRSLRCLPQEIEVLLSRCFLETHHWILAKSAFSGCSSVNRTDQGLRVQVFTLEKKEGTCGLRLSTNSSHAQYSLEVPLLHVLPDFTSTDATVLSFSCTYPLVVDVSQTQPYPVVPFPYITIHVPGTGDTIVILGIFTDPQLSAPLENRTAPVGKPLYVVLRATSSDPDRFALVANEVFASANISRMGAVEPTYHFVNESCPVSNRLLQSLLANGASLEVTLAFNLFRFLTSDTIYLHGRVTLCDKQAGRPCQPTCSRNSPRRNRAWEMRASEGLERGGSWLVFGPIRISESNASGSGSLTGAWMAIFLLMVIGWMLG